MSDKKAVEESSRLRSWGKLRDCLHHNRGGTPASIPLDWLRSAIGDTSQQLGGRVDALTNYLVTKGFSGQDAASAANRYLYGQLQRHVTLLLFTDYFWIMAADLSNRPAVVVDETFGANRQSACGLLTKESKGQAT